MHPQSSTRVLALLVTLVLGLAACGTPALAAASPTPTVYTAQDALAAWQAHGLKATLTPAGGPPPAGFTADYLVNPPLGSGAGFMMLAVAPSAAVAEASMDQFGHGPFLARTWRQGNLILRYSDDSANPYIAALADLR